MKWSWTGRSWMTRKGTDVFEFEGTTRRVMAIYETEDIHDADRVASVARDHGFSVKWKVRLVLDIGHGPPGADDELDARAAFERFRDLEATLKGAVFVDRQTVDEALKGRG